MLRFLFLWLVCTLLVWALWPNNDNVIVREIETGKSYSYETKNTPKRGDTIMVEYVKKEAGSWKYVKHYRKAVITDLL